MPGVGFIRPSSGVGGSVSVAAYSDSGFTNPITSAEIGDTIYIKSTVIGITPTEYRFFVFETASNGVATIQVGNSISYNITSFNDLVIYAEAKDASVAAAAFTSFEVTINSDADADAFIAAHNSNTGSTMAALQQQAVQGFFQRLKGIGTTNGSDIWSIVSANVNSRIFPLIPIDDSTASFDGYKLDCVNLSNGSYNNFIASDLSVNGVEGGGTKYFDTGLPPSAFGQNDISVHFYSRTNLEGSDRDVGASDASSYGAKQLAVTPNRSGSYRFDINNNGLLSTFSGASSTLGFYSAVRDGATTSYLYRNGLLVATSGSTSVYPTASNLYFHAHNQGGTIFNPSSRQLCFYAQIPSLNSFEIQDFEEAVLWLQQNVITGGRDV